MIKLGVICKGIIDNHFGSDQKCMDILNQVLSIDTPVRISCNRVHFGKDENGIYTRAVCECKIYKTNTKFIIIRDTDSKLYLKRSNGERILINNELNEDILKNYFLEEKTIIDDTINNMLYYFENN